MAQECGDALEGVPGAAPVSLPPARPQVVKNDLSPVWEPFKVSLCNLCCCEETRPLKVGPAGGGWGGGVGGLLQGPRRAGRLRGPGLPSASSGIMTPAESTISSGSSPPPSRRCRKLSGSTR